jgi:hypothetical protein
LREKETALDQTAMLREISFVYHEKPSDKNKEPQGIFL